LKLLIIWLLVFGSWFLVNTRIIHAETSTGSALPQANSNNFLNTNSDVPLNLQSYTQSLFIELAATVSCQLAGIDPIHKDAKCLGIDQETGKIGFVENGGGTVAVLEKMIAGTFYFPISTHQYGADLAANFGLTKKAYAQDAISLPSDGGLGFNSLLPTLNMWKAFRNITYMIFTFIFVIIGLGIMFRVKLDPRTVMTIQNQIPRIIIALVFITFSYALAGFLVDIMYVSIYIIIAIFAQQGYDTSTAVAANPFAAMGGFGGIGGVANGVSGAIAGAVKDMFQGTLGNVVGGLLGGIIGTSVGGGAGGLLGSLAETGTKAAKVAGPWGAIAGAVIGGVGGLVAGSKAVGLAAGVIVYLVVLVAVISSLFRLWFILIKSYLFVFLTTVFAPFYIASGALPGRAGISEWTKGMLSNLVVFPATITMFLLGKAFIDGFTQGDTVSGALPFVPPLIGDFASPDRMAAIIGLAVILLTPEVANMAKETLKVKDLKEGAAIGKGLGGATSMLTAGPKYGMSRLMKGPNLQTGDPGGKGYRFIHGEANRDLTPATLGRMPTALEKARRNVFGWIYGLARH
jgi:hypothetical protein